MHTLKLQIDNASIELDYESDEDLRNCLLELAEIFKDYGIKKGWQMIRAALPKEIERN